MKTNKKRLISSLVLVVACLALIAGSTYALFTSEDQVNIAITSGKVNVTAVIQNVEEGSELNAMLAETNIDVDQSERKITLDKIVPGDYVNFDIVVTNNSTVSVLYRTIVWMVEDNGLYAGLEVSIGDVVYNGNTKATAWEVLTPKATPETFTIPVSIKLPVDAGNEYQDKTCTIAYAVEAIQGNAYPAGDDGSIAETDTFYVYNDGGLAVALDTIKNDEEYWNKEVKIVLAPNTYTGNHVINQYPEWNGVVGAGGTQNNMSGLAANANYTNITFVGAEGVKFTGNVTVNGWGNAGNGFELATAKTTFQNITFDATSSIEDNGEDYIVVYAKAAANNVNFEGCTFENATHITLGGSGADGVGLVNFNNCQFNNGGCLSGAVETLNVVNSTINGADNGFINKSKAGVATVDNCVIEAGKYFLRTSNSGVELVVTNSEIAMYESEGAMDLVKFRGSNESATFTNCDIEAGWTIAGVDTNSKLYVDGASVGAAVSNETDLKQAIEDKIPNILLTGDLIIKEELQVATDTVINANGKTLYRVSPVATLSANAPTVYTGVVFTVKQGTTLTLENVVVDGGAVWSGEINEVLQRGTENTGVTATGALVATEANATIILGEGAILQNNCGANAVNLGTRTGGKLIVNGGEIINNYSAAGAIWGGGEIIINSGKINNNHGGIGGAIRAVTNIGTLLTMNGGEMNHNYSDGNGGAIWAGSSRSNNVYVLNGGEMAYNYSATTGGAIYAGYYETVKIGGTFKMHDNDCAADLGSAIRFHDHASLVMTGGEIYNHDDNAFFLNNNSASITGGKYEGDFGYSGGLGLTLGEVEIDGVINYNLATNHNTAYLAAEFGTIQFTVNETATNFAQFNFKPATGYVYTEGDEAKLVCMNEGYETIWDAATGTFRLQATN